MEEGEHMKRYSRFVWGLYYLRVRFPTMSVTSWGRSPVHNASLAGHEDASQHLEWTAADVTWDPGTEPPAGVLKAAAREVGIEVEPEGDHTHLELATGWLP